MKQEDTFVIRIPFSNDTKEMRDDSSEKGDHWKPPSPTSCSDSTIGVEVIAAAEGNRQMYDTSERWHDEWTLEAPLQQRPVAIVQIPLKQCRSREDDDCLVQTRTLKRQKTTFSSMLLDLSVSGEEPARKRCKKIRFKEIVDVVPIPTRWEYTLEMRSNVWSSAREIQENAARNTLEFAHDGWDWRKVADEELFQECRVSGTWIHPVHCTQLQTR